MRKIILNCTVAVLLLMKISEKGEARFLRKRGFHLSWP